MKIIILFFYFILIFLPENGSSKHFSKKSFFNYHGNEKPQKIEKNKSESIVLKYKDVKMLQKYLNNILKLSKNNDHVLIVKPEKPSNSFRQKEIDEKILLHSNNAKNRLQNNNPEFQKKNLQLKEKNNNFENDEIFQSFKINDDLKKEILQMEEGEK